MVQQGRRARGPQTPRPRPCRGQGAVGMSRRSGWRRRWRRHVRGPLVAGNWKMNGLCAVDRRDRRHPRRHGSKGATGRAEMLVCPPFPLVAAFARRASGKALADRRAGLPPRDLRRSYRRRLGRDAEGCRGKPRHRRPFRAAHGPWRDGRSRQGEGGGRASGRPRRDRLHRRDAGGARGRDRRWRSSDASSPARCRPRRTGRRHGRSPTSRSGRSAAG